MRKILILFLFFVCARAFAIGDNELKNPGLELDANGTVSGWWVMFKENTGHIDTKIFHGGKSSLYVEHFSGRGYFGLSQKIIYDSPPQLLFYLVVGAKQKKLSVNLIIISILIWFFPMVPLPTE